MYSLIPGAKRIPLQESMTSVSGASMSPAVEGKLPGKIGRWEWRLLGVEAEWTCSSVTTSTTASTPDRVARIQTPVTIQVDGWERNPYLNTRGDAIHRMILTQFGRQLAMNPGLVASITTGAMRLRTYYPFAGVLGRDACPFDSAPRADLLSSVSVGRDDTYFLSGDSFVAAPTVSFFAWVAPYQKVDIIPIPFQFSSTVASSATECRIPGSDRIHYVLATDVDESITNTTLLNALRVNAVNSIDRPISFHALVAAWNRACLPGGARSLDAYLEIVAASGAAAEVLSLPLLFASGHGKSYTKALANSDGLVAEFSAALDSTVADLHYHALRSWDVTPGSNVEAAYKDAAQIVGSAPVAASSKGHGPGTPYKLV